MPQSSPAAQPIVYKIMTFAEWATASAVGTYPGSADDRRDGFIHLSAAEQLRGTAEKHFRGRPDLILIALAAAQLGSALRWEPSRDGALFPHLYGTLDVSATVWTKAMPLDAGGIPIVPAEVQPC